MIETGFTVAVRGIYNTTQFHLRAVQGEDTVITEDRDLGKGLLKLRDEARRVLHKK